MSFRRAMIILTLFMWAALYLLFTLRALGMQRPLLTEQAICRLAMMPVGLFTCACLYLAATRAETLNRWQAGLLILASIAAAAIFYGTINYTIFYVVADYWISDYPPARKIAIYSLDLMWIFSTWMALFYLVRIKFPAPVQDHGERPSGYISEIWVKHKDCQLRIDLDDVSWFEAEGDYVRIHATGSSHLLRSTTTQMELKLDPALFIRIHRGVIISLSRLKRIRRRADGRVTVAMDNGLELPVGRAYLHRLRRLTRQPLAVEETETGHPSEGLRPAARSQ